MENECRKVLIWGIGEAFRQNKHELYEMVEFQELEILALISKDGGDSLDSYPIIQAKDIKKYTYDKIIICAQEEITKDIMKDAKELGIEESKLQEYIKFYMDTKQYERFVIHQCDVLKEILAASDEQVQSYEWMYQKIIEFGVFPLPGTNHEIAERSYLGIAQNVKEFAKYCNYISQLDNMK